MMSKKSKAKIKWAATPRIEAALKELNAAFEAAAAAHSGMVRAMMIVGHSTLGQASLYDGCACSECQRSMVKALRAIADKAHDKMLEMQKNPTGIRPSTRVH